ncbi:conserved hypothetical protein [Ricinus communis]|uniref:Uncharacterized protein n=1 Tax=Ricinus communis TaxID=3988 RepID=B9RIS5_RICCO|nr:conserved hypothetical protein [Ricinus communis]|eukprot:XP_002513644.1 uncharacterized protein PAM68-like [Ricinus communis]
MNALVSSQRSPLYLTKPSPQWKSKTPSHHPTIFRSQNNPSTRSRLNANAKGFTSRKPPHMIKENTLDIKTTTSNEHNGSDDEELPKEVVNRVIKRILVSVGVPMALGLAFLKFFGSVREQGIWDVPVWIVFATTFLTFGTSALGIAYGALSASLDPNKKGSLLGFEEVQENWVEMWKEEDGNN